MERPLPGSGGTKYPGRPSELLKLHQLVKNVILRGRTFRSDGPQSLTLSSAQVPVLVLPGTWCTVQLTLHSKVLCAQLSFSSARKVTSNWKFDGTSGT